MSPFSARLQEQFQSARGVDALKGMRESAWDHFLELGLPEKNAEPFRYLPLRQLYTTDFAVRSRLPLVKNTLAGHIYPECAHSHFVFVDGEFSEALSDFSALPAQIVISPLAEAMRSYGNFLQNRGAKALREERDPFAVLNAAVHTKGLFIYIPPKCVVETPIQCLQLTSSGHSFPRIQLLLGAGAEARWIASAAPLAEEPYWVSGVFDVALEEGAQFHFTSCCQVAETGWYFEAMRATLKQNSRLRAVSATTGGKAVRYDYRIALTGENSEADLSGIAMLEGSRQAHTYVVVEHQAPHCRSMQLFKGVLNGISQSSFEGKILVRQAAQKTQAYQLNNYLILGERAIANSKPNLEIFADDVKASHGATVTQLDPRQVFYLSARGLSPLQAKTLLIGGFCKQITDRIPHVSARRAMDATVANYLYAGV